MSTVGGIYSGWSFLAKPFVYPQKYEDPKKAFHPLVYQEIYKSQLFLLNDHQDKYLSH